MKLDEFGVDININRDIYSNLEELLKFFLINQVNSPYEII
jgi:hypothetical protein